MMLFGVERHLVTQSSAIKCADLSPGEVLAKKLRKGEIEKALSSSAATLDYLNATAWEAVPVRCQVIPRARWSDSKARKEAVRMSPEVAMDSNKGRGCEI